MQFYCTPSNVLTVDRDRTIEVHFHLSQNASCIWTVGSYYHCLWSNEWELIIQIKKIRFACRTNVSHWMQCIQRLTKELQAQERIQLHHQSIVDRAWKRALVKCVSCCLFWCILHLVDLCMQCCLHIISLKSSFLGANHTLFGYFVSLLKPKTFLTCFMNCYYLYMIRRRSI